MEKETTDLLQLAEILENLTVKEIVELDRILTFDYDSGYLPYKTVIQKVEEELDHVWYAGRTPYTNRKQVLAESMRVISGIRPIKNEETHL
jgi:hypothetical protein